ncbi:hypothetical protein AB0L34_10380 [Micromonospora sp. NPDC052213]
MSLHFCLPTIALPLWIVGHPSTGLDNLVLTLVKTLLVVLLQVRGAR